ncbi:hypothetical protein Tco_0044464 [Tanacetum coccineum]
MVSSSPDLPVHHTHSPPLAFVSSPAAVPPQPTPPSPSLRHHPHRHHHHHTVITTTRKGCVRFIKPEMGAFVVELVVAEVAAEAPTQVPKQPGHPRQQRSILSYSKWALAANIGMPLLGPMATQGLCIFNLNTILQPNSSAISLIGMPRAITLSILPVSY